MTSLAADALDAFASSPIGTRAWVAGLGRSMAPLLSSGDALELERTDRVRRGDIALVRRGAQFIAHVVVEVDPLRTASVRGVPDEGALEVIGRAVAIRRGGVRLPLPLPMRLGLFGIVTGYERLLRSQRATAAARALRDAALGPLTSSLRAVLMGRITVRPLTSDDSAALIRFVSDHGRLTSVFTQSRLAASSGLTVGAFAGGGALIGMCLMDDYQRGTGVVVHKLFVAPAARHLGVGERVLTACLEDARRRGRRHAFANAHDADASGRRLLHRLGFRPDAATVNELRSLAARAPVDAFDGYVVKEL